MVEVVKQGKKWVVVDHILNLNSAPFRKKADADFAAAELLEKYNEQLNQLENETPDQKPDTED